MSDQASLGLLLRRHREERLLTLEGLSEASGVSVRAIGDLERGIRAPRRRTVEALGAALDLADPVKAALRAAARDAMRRHRSTEATTAVRPHALTDFTGRGADVDALVTLIAPSGDGPRSIVLSGPPGIGKTSVALEASHRGALGRTSFYVDLAGASPTPMTALEVLGALLAQAPDGPDAPSSLREAAAEWARLTATTAGVVVLDDAGSEAQVRPALAAGPGFRVIVTSRRSLAGLEAVQHRTLGRWSRAESVRFLERAVPAEHRSENDVAALAELCGDLPLALRIVAGRIAAQPSREAADLVDRLRSASRRLRLLSAGDLDVERAFDTSYDLLPASQQRLFRTLGLLPTRSFTAAAAAAVDGADEDETLELLEDLVDLGLVEPLDRERFRLHDLLRLFALARLERETPDLEPATRTLDRWYLTTAAHAADLFAPDKAPLPTPSPAPEIRFSDRQDAGRWLREEVDGWFAALQRTADAGRHLELLHLARHIERFVDDSRDLGRWLEFFDRMGSSAAAIGAHRLEVSALTRYAYTLVAEAFDHEGGRAAALRAIAVAREVDAPEHEADALMELAQAEQRLGRPDDARRALQRASELFAEIGDAEGAMWARLVRAKAVITTAPGAAEAELRAILDATGEEADGFSISGRRKLRASAQHELAIALIAAGRPDEAIDFASASIAGADGDPGVRARGHAQRGWARLAAGDPVEGARDLREALRIAGDHRPQYWADRIDQALRELDG